VNLEDMKREIEALVVAKGFSNSREDVPKKLLFAFIELRKRCAVYGRGGICTTELMAKTPAKSLFFF